jgi:hypothetical protein
MSHQRTHRYCGGRGFITLASGAPGHCFACNGTGKLTVYTAAEKAAQRAKRDRWESARSLIESHARKMTAPAGVSSMTFRLDTVAGFDALGEREPARMERLYTSLDAGRLDDVVRALYAYRTASEGETCTTCRKGNLPRGMMCEREAATQGVCLRCCPHNHG